MVTDLEIVPKTLPDPSITVEIALKPLNRTVRPLDCSRKRLRTLQLQSKTLAKQTLDCTRDQGFRILDWITKIEPTLKICSRNHSKTHAFPSNY
jgi:hypothetical protein